MSGYASVHMKKKINPQMILKHSFHYFSDITTNKLKWVAFSENNRPKTKNYATRSYKILQKLEFNRLK